MSVQGCGCCVSVLLAGQTLCVFRYVVAVCTPVVALHHSAETFACLQFLNGHRRLVRVHRQPLSVSHEAQKHFWQVSPLLPATWTRLSMLLWHSSSALQLLLIPAEFTGLTAQLRPIETSAPDYVSTQHVTHASAEATADANGLQQALLLQICSHNFVCAITALSGV